jgi:1-acyl-sn-glycerol-3-phosphate acyltransferase
MPEDCTGRLAAARVLGRLWLRLFGWTLRPPPPAVPAKFVFVAAPHTSGWDLPFMLATASALGIRISWFGKHTLFRPPSVGSCERSAAFPSTARRHTTW